MRAVLVSASLWAGLGLVSCKSNDSKLDKAPAADPWGGGGASASATKSEGGALAGFDWEGTLEKVKTAIETPGPYESPKESADFDATKPHWGVLGLDGEIVEREAFSITSGGGSGTELRQLVGRLRALSLDATLIGLVLRIDSLAISLPDVAELRVAMNEFRAVGKQLRCHIENADNAGYLVLTACDSIGIAPLGTIAITGPSAMPIHLKPLLDKFDVRADFIHVGAYKGAAEPLTRDAPSQEMQETLGAILDRRYDTMVETIATARKIDPGVVKGLIDTALFPSDAAKAAKLVDEVATWEVFRDAPKAAWTKLELEPDDDNQLASMMKIARFLGAMPPEKPMGDHVAVVYALGDIKDGSGDGVLGARQEIASHTLVAALHALTNDNTVKAVVLRIDSGGGSAQASELIWTALEELRAKKPVVVSMSDVAASGGYYIAAGANKIFAHADTLTGSIGVVGGRVAPGPALAKLGVNTFPIGRGKHATMMSSLAPWTPDEKALMQRHMEEVYKVFTSRVAAGRKLAPDKVQQIAQGRVWTGLKAKELGLVDEIGGLDEALAEARTLGKVDAKTDIEIYPPSPTLRDLLAGWGQVHTPLGVSATATVLAELREMSPEVADATARLLSLVDAFRGTPIQAVAVLPVLR